MNESLIGGAIILLVFIAIIAFVYFIPSFVAFSGKKRNAEAIFLLNVFLGWTFIGWVASLVWATMKDKGEEK